MTTPVQSYNLHVSTIKCEARGEASRGGHGKSVEAGAFEEYCGA